MANFTFKSTVSIGQLFVIDAGNFDVDIDAVQQRAADFFLVAGDGHGGAAAFSHRVAVEAAGTGVQVAVATRPSHQGCTFATPSRSGNAGALQVQSLNVKR
ncbi:MAG TPA: hypothetical protein VJQ26_01770 [Ktedonobacteraceae bacterium]|nr:hypothetical protein [Ktedonobacteraceae bacterium]